MSLHMAAAEDEDKTKLGSWYSAHDPLEKVTERDLVKFFSLATKYSVVPTLSQMQYAGHII